VNPSGAAARANRRAIIRCAVVVVLLTVLSAGAALLYAHDPVAARFYPTCPFHDLTGLYCPGCGSTRAMHQLLHGHLRAAMGYNAVMVLCLPFAVVGMALEALRVVRGRRLTETYLSPWLIRGIAAAFTAFWVLRNIPAYPFFYLAPHAVR